MNKLKKIFMIIIIGIIIIMQFSIVNAVAKNNNPMLKGIKINGKNIEPQFEMFTTEYVLTVGEEIGKIDIEPIPDDEKARVQIKGDTNLKLGRNEIEIQVTAEDEKAKQSYFLYITRGNNKDATNANLEKVEIKNCELAPIFNKDVINYTFEYPANLEKVEIEAIPENKEAKVEIIGNEELKEVTQNIEIKVTAEDGQTIRKYYFIVKKSGLEVESPEGEEKEVITEKQNSNNLEIYWIIVVIIILLFVMIIRMLVNKRGRNENAN